MPAKYKEVTPKRDTSAEEWMSFATGMRQHGNITQAAKEAGISRSTAARALRNEAAFPLYRRAKDMARQLIPDPVKEIDQLSPEARRALVDFAYFRTRYFGRVSTPWAVHTANLVAEKLATPQKEYIVVNEPPGVGKSTFWTIDLPAWLICRNRGVRIQLGSAAQSTAQDYTQQLRREFEREHPPEADEDSKRKGLAVDAVATLMDDFGAFKPPRGEPWTAEQFVVKQGGDKAKQNKEATVKALGRDTKFLGKRCNLIVWDDLVDERGVKTAESREDLLNWWQQFAETRLEPGGLCVLQGQRLHADDLYQSVVKIEVDDYGDDDDEGWGEPVGVRRQYTHIRYKAHYDEHCQGDHHPARALPYNPDNPKAGGCLLDPKRLTFRDCMTVKNKDPRLYAVSYQQEDIDPAQVLVNPLWITGGRDIATQEEFPGCWDKDRSMGVVPQLTGQMLSYVTGDPSPTKFWSVQWWVYHVPSEQRFLIDHVRKRMEATDFITNIIGTHVYQGLLEDWHVASVKQGAPITHVIVERNAAQRWLIYSTLAKDWAKTRKVTFVAHDTYGNKADPKLGVESLLPPVYKYGLCRLPSGDGASRARSQQLVAEVTRYPESSTTDCVMSQWFGEFNLPPLVRQADRPANPPTMNYRLLSSQEIGGMHSPL